VAAAELLESQGIKADFVAIDVTDQATILTAAKAIDAKYGRLNILVPSPTQLDLDMLRQTYAINVFGMFAVTQAMLPLLRKASEARIVNMFSGLASLSQASDPRIAPYLPHWLAYNSSKTTVNAMTVQLAYELKDAGIKVNAADPGYVRTELSGGRGDRTVEEGAQVAVRLACLPADGPTGTFFDENGPAQW